MENFSLINHRWSAKRDYLPAVLGRNRMQRQLSQEHPSTIPLAGLIACQQQRVTINHPLDNSKVAVGYGLVWKVKESGEQHNHNDTRQRPLPRAKPRHGGHLPLVRHRRQAKNEWVGLSARPLSVRCLSGLTSRMDEDYRGPSFELS